LVLLIYNHCKIIWQNFFDTLKLRSHCGDDHYHPTSSSTMILVGMLKFISHLKKWRMQKWISKSF